MNERQKAIVHITTDILGKLMSDTGPGYLRPTAYITFDPDHPIFGASVSLAYLADALRLEVLPALNDGGVK